MALTIFLYWLFVLLCLFAVAYALFLFIESRRSGVPPDKRLILSFLLPSLLFLHVIVLIPGIQAGAKEKLKGYMKGYYLSRSGKDTLVIDSGIMRYNSNPKGHRNFKESFSFEKPVRAAFIGDWRLSDFLSDARYFFFASKADTAFRVIDFNTYAWYAPDDVLIYYKPDTVALKFPAPSGSEAVWDVFIKTNEF